MNKTEVLFAPLTPVEESEYPGFHPETTIIPKGSVHCEGGSPIPCDILCERDVAVKLRDGVTIYMDIFRPVDGKDLPALVVWSPYGKRGCYFKLDAFPNRMGIPADWEDGLNKFEGPNPGYWVNHGYAVIHPDARGTFSSEGDVYVWGKQEAEDEYDLIEWVARQEWSNGKVGTTGNSWLAISQWNVAGYNPPHLAAIAPWEGLTDGYRDAACKGGVPDYPFIDDTFSHFFGHGKREDLPGMIRKYPCMNDYWQGKIARLEDIKVPAYVAASFTNILHSHGTFEGWSRIASKEKWLRVHTTQEWYDYYTPEHVEDLRKFFDCYLKGLDNGWKSTPRVRMSVLDAGHKPLPERAEQEFPLQRQRVTRFYLDAASRTLSPEMPAQESHVSYDSAGQEEVSFKLRFAEDTEITGYMSVRLWVAAESADDMDIFAYVRKCDSSGKFLPLEVVNGATTEGAHGRLRVSLRKLDEAKSRPEKPFYTFDTPQKLAPGEIVPIEIELWPVALQWHAGEQLEVLITGHERLVRPEMPWLESIQTCNEGRHVLYTGGKYDSCLIAPIIPQAGR